MGSRGTLKSADRATTHGCLDWRSDAIFKLKGTSHDSIFQFSLFPTLADIFAV